MCIGQFRTRADALTTWPPPPPSLSSVQLGFRQPNSFNDMSKRRNSRLFPLLHAYCACSFFSRTFFEKVTRNSRISQRTLSTRYRNFRRSLDKSPPPSIKVMLQLKNFLLSDWFMIFLKRALLGGRLLPLPLDSFATFQPPDTNEETKKVSNGLMKTLAAKYQATAAVVNPEISQKVQEAELSAIAKYLK